MTASSSNIRLMMLMHLESFIFGFLCIHETGQWIEFEIREITCRDRRLDLDRNCTLQPQCMSHNLYVRSVISNLLSLVPPIGKVHINFVCQNPRPTYTGLDVFNKISVHRLSIIKIVYEVHSRKTIINRIC